MLFKSTLLFVAVCVATKAELSKELPSKRAAEELCKTAKKGKPNGLKHGDQSHWYASYDIAPYEEMSAIRNEYVTYKVRFEVENCNSKSQAAKPTIVRCTLLLCDDQVRPKYTKPNACGKVEGPSGTRTEYSMHENAQRNAFDQNFEIDYEERLTPVLITEQDKKDYSEGKKQDSVVKHQNVKQRLTCINWEAPTFGYH